jgi:hypothetical protein
VAAVAGEHAPEPAICVAATMCDTRRVDAAFLVVVSKSSTGLRSDAINAAIEPSASDLGFEPDGRVQWRDAKTTIAFQGWQAAPVALGQNMWWVDDQQVLMSTGHHRWRHQPWSADRQWANELVRATRRAGLVDATERLHGIFSIVWLDASGLGTVVADPLGLRCVYYGETDDVVAVASRPALVARALTPPERRLTRDPAGTAWLAFTSYRVGHTTGFDGVRVLPAGGVITIRSHAGVSIRRGAPWMPDDAMAKLSTDELVEYVREDIADTLRATTSFPVERRVIGLTGGKDSRLLLAIALWGGIAQEFDYETIGPPDLADVRIASQLAEQFKLRHEVRFHGMASAKPYADRLRDFASATAGMLNIWDLSAHDTQQDSLRITGLCGETLRTFRPLPHSVESKNDLLALFPRTAFGRLRLLHPDFADEQYRAALDILLDDPSRRSEPFDLFDAYYFRNRLRFTRTGPQEELPREPHVFPLYSIGALRAAFALGGAARQSELLHFEITRRCSGELARHPFVGTGWNPNLHAGETSFVSEPASTPAAKVESLMQRVQARAYDERKKLFLAIIEDRNNPVWDYVSRDATQVALDRFESLNSIERREVFGAVTAALWLGDSGSQLTSC